jgi:hypothetical protein
MTLEKNIALERFFEVGFGGRDRSLGKNLNSSLVRDSRVVSAFLVALWGPVECSGLKYVDVHQFFLSAE